MRRKQHERLLALVVLSACFVRVSAAEVPVRPFGVIQAGDAQVTLSREGCFWLTCPDKTTALKAQLIVLGEVGKGAGNQATCRLLDGYPKKDGKSFVFRGEIDDPASEKTWRFEQRVEPVENAIRFSYQIEPLADGKVAEVSLFIDLPVDRWCGKRLFFWPREESLLPENSGLEEYFVSGVARSVVLDVGGRRQVTFQFAEPTFCCGRDMRALQDARETRLPLYRISPILFRGGNVEGGRKYRLEFTLAPNDRRSYVKTPIDHSSTEPFENRYA